jgi:hypothetical protein
VLLGIATVQAFCASPAEVGKAFAGKDARVHIVRSDGAGELVVPPEPGQDSVQQIKVAVDRRTVGWLVSTYASCCVSYAIPVDLVIWRDGHIVRRFHSAQFIAEWNFARGAREVTFSTEVLHGDADATCYRKDIATGKQLESWACGN